MPPPPCQIYSTHKDSAPMLTPEHPSDLFSPGAMSRAEDGRVILSKKFARIPAFFDLPAVERGSPSSSNVSSSASGSTLRDKVDLGEGCFITKAYKFTHQLAHWVNAARSSEQHEDEVCFIIDELGIIPYSDFKLNDPCNLAYLDSSIHTALDLYAMIAVTASSSTIDELLAVVKADNDRRLEIMNRTGRCGHRRLDFSLPCIASPRFELVALHPQHFLPKNAVLPMYNQGQGTHTNYVAADDGSLRETHNPSSHCLPPFCHNGNRNEMDQLNVFLVVMNADFKFRGYFAMGAPSTLPPDTLSLMKRTIELVNLIYWQPPQPDLEKGKEVSAQEGGNSGGPQRNKGRLARPQGAMSGTSTFRRRLAAQARLKWLRDVDVETRKEFCSALMNGSVEDVPFFSEPAVVEDWRNGVSSDSAAEWQEGQDSPQETPFDVES